MTDEKKDYKVVPVEWAGPGHSPDCILPGSPFCIHHCEAERVAGTFDEKINHPSHYGGDVPFEAIKLIESWGLGFKLGNALKYIIRAPHKGTEIEDLKKAVWYIRRHWEHPDPKPQMLEVPWIDSDEAIEFWKLDPQVGAIAIKALAWWASGPTTKVAIPSAIPGEPVHWLEQRDTLVLAVTRIEEKIRGER